MAKITDKLLHLFYRMAFWIHPGKPRELCESNRPIRVVFLCHMPAVWGKLEPVYRAMVASADFEALVVTVPQPSESDTMIKAWLAARGISALQGRNGPDWISLRELHPDYVFHSVPYSTYFPWHMSAEFVADFARLCYVPYVGQLIYKGSVADTTHDPSYFRKVRLAFLADAEERRSLSRHVPTLRADSYRVVGSPQADEIIERTSIGTSRGSQLRLLWTPRWHTKEGNCHFFEHKDLLLDMAEADPGLRLVFRPHPLCFQNFVRTGELSQDDLNRLLARIESLPNVELDAEGDYLQTIARTDVFVSDMSSMLSDFFLTGRPIIYTHRNDTFNELGNFMSQGFYWVKDPEELKRLINRLKAGDDPLRKRRLELRAEYLTRVKAGATGRILEAVRHDSRRD